MIPATRGVEAERVYSHQAMESTLRVGQDMNLRLEGKLRRIYEETVPPKKATEYNLADGSNGEYFSEDMPMGVVNPNQLQVDEPRHPLLMRTVTILRNYQTWTRGNWKQVGAALFITVLLIATVVGIFFLADEGGRQHRQYLIRNALQRNIEKYDLLQETINSALGMNEQNFAIWKSYVKPYVESLQGGGNTRYLQELRARLSPTIEYL